ncbi:MAG TPA: hypothetical protein C5S51_10500 [Methanosarcinaceae archaeon]|nr:hypothetical protein [Methanosarcinaceae archaeon]
MKMPLIINDHEKIESVYRISEDYLMNHNNLPEEIMTYLKAYYEAYHLVPQTAENFWSGHSFSFSTFHE